jgi:hypothetical protein
MLPRAGFLRGADEAGWMRTKHRFANAKQDAASRSRNRSGNFSIAM